MAEVGPSVLWVAQVTGPRPDPAFDSSHKNYNDALTRYAKTRAKKHLDAIPLRDGRKPRLYAVQLMTPSVYAAVMSLPSDRPVAQFHFSVALTVHQAIVGGTTHTATFRPKETLAIADDAWMEQLARWGGEHLLVELGGLATRRADLGDLHPDEDAEEGTDPLELFDLPRGMVRSRSAK